MNDAATDLDEAKELLRQHVMDYGKCDHRWGCDCSDGRAWRWLRARGIVVLAVAAVLAATPLAATASTPPAPITQAPATPLTASPAVTEAAMILASHGYTVTTPARLDKAVRHWQKVNGLLVDGIVTSGGPTLASLRASLPPPAASAPRRKAAPTGQKAAPAPAPEPVDVPLSATPGDAESIIRAVWPDDVEDWAVAIARRESNLQPGAGNSCCKGLFAIHWYAHQAWLSDYGANSPSDLYDPTINARVALALFQQAGVAPWLCHGLCKDIPL